MFFFCCFCSYLSVLTCGFFYFFSHQNQAEVVEVAEEEEEVLEAAGLWEWEAFSKVVFQNYAQLEVNSTVMFSVTAAQFQQFSV